MHPYVKTGLIALAAVMAITIAQKKFMNVPVVGEFLPGYTPRA